jgi:hypothetical protein
MTIKIDVTSAEHVQLMRLTEAVRELNDIQSAAGLDPLVLVSRQGKLVSPARSDLRTLTVDSLAATIRSVCEPGRFKKDGEDLAWVPQPKVPRDLVRAYMDSGHWPGVPEVRSIATTPLVRPDFTVRWATGWDAATSVWVKKGVVEDRSLIGRDLRGLFKEFSLVDRRLEADCLAAALTPLLAHALSGALPGFIVTAPKPSSGKSELAQLMARIGGAGGDTVTRWPGRDEFTKTVSSYVADSEGVVIFDNIKSHMDSPDLESVMTSRRTSFREMFTHGTRALRSDTTWFFTVNGAHVSPDILRRCVVVLLDTERHPAVWTGTVPTNTRKHEAALVTLLVSQIEAWRDVGSPMGAVRHPGFEQWSGVVSGILEHAGIDGMWDARSSVISEAVSVAGEDDGDLLERIADLMGADEFTSTELWEQADSKSFDARVRVIRDYLKSARSAGAMLRPLKGRTFEGSPYRLEARRSNGKNLWKVARTDGKAVVASVDVQCA